jgi:hypothetical protein
MAPSVMAKAKSCGCVEPWQPPVPPQWSGFGAQSTYCCSLSEVLVWLLMSSEASMAPTPEKAQQLPQLPWFFTGLTLPSSRQSKLDGMPSSGRRSPCSAPPAALRHACLSKPRYRANSSSVMSENCVTPCCHLASW